MSRDFFRGKKAVVTGAASGIGLEFCRQLTAAGCSVLMIDRSPLEQAAAEISAGAAPGVAVAAMRLDLTGADAPDRIIRRLDEDSCCPDLLVNNAGIFDFKTVRGMSRGRLETYVDLHVRAVTLLCRLVGGRMAAAGGGRIVNMSSMSCWMPMPGIAMYSATKAYIRVFSRALAHETGRYGVKVLVACPGGIATDLFGLPPRLQRLGVRLGVLATPRKLVAAILKRSARGKRQYINGPLNRAAIFLVSLTPGRLREKITDYAEKSDE